LSFACTKIFHYTLSPTYPAWVNQYYRPVMKEIKLSGRERTVLRYIDWATGTAGSELQATTRLEAEDLVAVLNGLMEVGYIETEPYTLQTDEATFAETVFEVNPSYALDLKAAMARL
jgi:hypothetical protein